MYTILMVADFGHLATNILFDERSEYVIHALITRYEHVGRALQTLISFN